MDAKSYTVHIYQGEAELISMWTLRYKKVETGGDIFGLWLSENELVIQAVLGPGQNCRRTPTSFFQDEQYLSRVGEVLTINQGLCNIGSWHSHHSMNLPEPSRGDKDTIWRHLPAPGRFLLLIAMIEWRNGEPKVSMTFNLFEATSKGNKVTRMKLKILEGESPIRANAAVSNQISQGAEVHSRKTSSRKRESQTRRTKETEPDEKAKPKQRNEGHLPAGRPHEPQESGRVNLKCDGLVDLYHTRHRPHDPGHLKARSSRQGYQIYGHRVTYVPRGDGREDIIFFHFDHQVGQCQECQDVELVEKYDRRLYAVHRQRGEDSCCTIL